MFEDANSEARSSTSEEEQEEGEQNISVIESETGLTAQDRDETKTAQPKCKKKGGRGRKYPAQ